MKLRFAQLTPFRLEYLQNAFVRKKRLDFREGLVLSVRTECGLTTCSEISPLLFLNTETLAQAKKQGQWFAETNLGKELESISTSGLFPSVQMGFDLAFLRLKSLTKKTRLGTFLSPEAVSLVKVKSLIVLGEKEEAIPRILQDLSLGFESFKIKVGLLKIDKEIRQLKKIRSIVGPKVEISLDANRSLSLEHALGLASALKKVNIAFFEEPVSNQDDLAKFLAQTEAKVALDETLLEEDGLSRFLNEKNACFWIVKPGLVGGFEQMIKLFKIAKNNGKKLVFSSSFESGLGHFLWAELASAFSPSEFHGLSPVTWLREDLLTPPLRIFRGQIDLQQANNCTLR